MGDTLTVMNGEGRMFTVRIVREGDKYGRTNILTHDKADPLIEFYDQTYRNCDEWQEYGQFVSRYYLSTLRDPDSSRSVVVHGLSLDGGVPEWTITAGNVLDVLNRWGAE